jgi:predicted dehydrogenase
MVKVGIVGCGTITMVRHAPEYYNNPDAEIAGFYDIVPERAAELAGKFGGKVYETCDELLADTTIDAVSICTANDTHAEYTVKALAAGKMSFVRSRWPRHWRSARG